MCVCVWVWIGVCEGDGERIRGVGGVQVVSWVESVKKEESWWKW